MPCTSILSLFSSRLYSDQFIFTLRSLSYVHSHLPGYVLLSGFAFFLDFFTAFLSFMSILSCPVPYFSLASGEFWTYLLFFCALCPFSPARFRISLWLPENFGLFSCFSRLYVHFLLPGSVLLSGFMFFLDFFTAFLCFMSIFSCPVPYFSLASGCFWTFLLFFSALCPFSPARFRISLWLPENFGLFSCFFSALCPFSPARFRISLWLPENFGLFYCFSRLYVHFLSSIYSSFRISLWLPENFGLFPAFSVLYVHSHRLCSVLPSGFRMSLDFFTAFLGLMSIFTCSVQCFSLVSRSFWTFFLAFLCFMSIFTCSVRYFHLASRSFWTFSLVFLSFISIWKSIEVSGLRKVRKSLDYDEFGSL